ncbi:PP2C family protein-serine/threonine phosphatase [Gimesia alba]|uniref:PP2C family protein-serine/threonine phosphatase n=1 Tax=Gimesia alba TaxID=2527973 RepID=UPI0018D5B794|nr:SpoIIE family protein phosphatase [Gimesia alba]
MNVVLAVFVVLFLIFSYQRNLAERLAEKRIALDEEAATLLPSILEMQNEGKEAVQQYLETICAQMQEIHAPVHHIVVRFQNGPFKLLSEHGASAELLQVIQKAARSPKHATRFENSEIVIGTYTQSGVTVYVSETLDNLYGSVFAEVLNNLTGFIILSLITGIVINIALTTIVTRPLHHLVQTVQEIGQGQLGAQSETFHCAELNYLTHEINDMSTSLAAAENIRKLQMAKARKIQENLLPKRIKIPGLNVTSLFQPADEVGGDYYDILPLSDGAWLFCIADITGHGISAAMSAAVLKTLLIQATEHTCSPAEILDFINRRFTVVSPVGEFVSMQLLRVVPRTHSIEYASAGHEPACFLSPTGELSDSETTGLLLGIDEDAEWDNITLYLTLGHRMLLITDGVSETHTPEGEMFGRKRLTALLQECQHLSIEETTQQLQESLSHFRNGSPQQDDVTVLLIEMTEA